MSTVTMARPHVAMGPRSTPAFDRLTWRMVKAEFLKIRRRRGLVAWSLLLTIGVVVVVFGVLAIQHAQNPVRHPPAGGEHQLAAAMGVLAMLGSVAAISVGAAAGAGDLQAGVFRDLVSTGRSRTALFAARVPGGLLLLWPLLLVAWSLACGASVAFAAGDPTASASAMLQGGGWVLLATTSNYLLALAIASALGSRSAAIGAPLGWLFVVSPLLMGLGGLGVARNWLQMAALTKLIPGPLRDGPQDSFMVGFPVALAFVVLAVWAAVSLAVGAWATRTRDA